MRVPALVYSPLVPVEQRGSKISSLYHVIDWTPTFLSLAGKENHGDQFDGISLWPALTENRNTTPRTSLILNIDIDDQSNSFQFSVRKDNWKLIWGQSVLRVHEGSLEDHFELYNLDIDPGETNDLAKSKTKVVEQLKKLLLEAADDMKPSFHPNRYSLGYPRYHNGIMETGWCASNWWDILWAPSIGRSIVLRELQQKHRH